MAGVGNRVLVFVTSRWVLVAWFALLAIGLLAAYVRRFAGASTGVRVWSAGLGLAVGGLVILAQRRPEAWSGRTLAAPGVVIGAGLGVTTTPCPTRCRWPFSASAPS